MPTASLRGITVAYDDSGPHPDHPQDAPPVLLIHGHPFDRTMWRPQAEQLAAAGHRVIVPDLRGYGESTVRGGTCPLAKFARDAAALLDLLDVPGAVVGGLSMGGQIAMEFHRLFPERVRGLVLAATSAPAETAEGRVRRAAMADRLLAEGMAGYAEEVLDSMVSARTRRDRPQVAEHVRRMMLAAPPEGAAAALRGRARRPNYRPSLRKVAVPTLVVAGTEDPFTPLPDALLIWDLVPGARLAVVQGAAHLPNLERPEDVTPRLEALIGEAAAHHAAENGTITP
ncbi:alpha/beta fold hydrolase [Nocardiopsis composta]|uniref:Pimeloyl-ACP methyl ester carboxylesterase n=1 Tax=Nocardiopsis composta TaxID=157465 RepID=A0A7W8VCC3_9ACTN|nr:alpha/beta fold hydrolase [Nocardiopsis composta]MBB5430778.1 pimeloyl-ACP methyl ester carboxylesterase [Nocardiopsis composta]